MGEWAAALPVTIVTLLLVLVPGVAALRGAGVRGLAMIAFAPLLSIAGIAVAAIVLGAARIPWSPASLGVVLLLVVALAWILGRVLGLPADGASARTETRRWLLPLGLGLGILFGAWRLIAYIQDPVGISQTNDAVFHMNAVRYILDTGNASSLHVSGVIGGQGFYPGAWHAVVSAVVAITGAPIPLAANAFTLVIGAVIWPLGLAWLTRTLTGSARVAGIAAVLSGALQLYPLLMFQWGVLFPNALSVAVLPAAVAVVLVLPAWYRPERAAHSWIRGVLFVGIALAALALAQPAALPVWGLVCVIWFTHRLLSAPSRIGRAPRIAVIVIAWVALGVAWVLLAGGTGGSHWPPFRSKFEAIVDVLLNSQLRVAPAWGITLLMLIGVVVVARRPTLRWFGVVWVALSVLYGLVASVGMPLVRDVLLAPWYADPYRIAAFAPLAVIPLAALGLDLLASWSTRALGRREDHDEGSVRAVAGIAVAAAGMLLIVCLRPVPMPAFLEGTYDAESRYITADDTYLNVDERSLLEALPEYVEPGSRVIANPSSGAGFGYMLSGVDVFPRTWSPPRTAAWATIASSLRDVGTDTEVCDALDAYGHPEYVLDFGPGERAPGRFRMPGMTDFAGKPGFERVAERGDVSLWRITACAR